MKPYEDNHIRIFNRDCRDMSELPDESVDLIATDPPYGISFMGKDWDRALPDKRIWAECLRVLKPGAFAFVMSIPRADCLSRMVISLEDAGFWVNFTPIFWAYASGFPKAQNIGKAVDKRLGVERKDAIRGGHRGIKREGGDVPNEAGLQFNLSTPHIIGVGSTTRGEPATLQAKALDGSYGGFQPKPAVEVILVAMKPLCEKTFVDQALKNRKGITWLDDGRIPYESERDFDKTARPNKENTEYQGSHPFGKEIYGINNPTGRFPANLICSDDVLNDGRDRKSGGSTTQGALNNWGDNRIVYNPMSKSSGSFSRYFDLDKWWAKTFPFLIVPKASKSEKDKLVDMPRVVKSGLPLRNGSGEYVENVGGDGSQSTRRTRAKNIHPTVKPLKLMAYLITLGSREGDTVLDNFGGSGTTAVAARLLGRKCVMYEIDERYCEIAVHRLRQLVMELTP